MNGRTKMMLAQTAARRGRGNDYGNPYDNEKPNNNYNGGREMRDRPYYGYEGGAPVNVIMPPVRYDGMNYDRRMNENRYNEGGNRNGNYNGYDGGEMEYRGGSYNYSPYPPPMYENYGESRKIGFDGSSETGGSRRETNSRNIFFGGSSDRGRSYETGVTKEKAQEWTKDMKNSDGSTGAHWNMDQTKTLKEKMGFGGLDPIEFYVAVNMMYSDYCAVAKKYNLDNAEFYGHMAKAFLDDKDAGPGKLAKYFEIVVDDD